jgi:galactosylceramidase
VNGGGATSVLLKDYPEPQRSQNPRPGLQAKIWGVSQRTLHRDTGRRQFNAGLDAKSHENLATTSTTIAVTPGGFCVRRKREIQTSVWMVQPGVYQAGSATESFWSQDTADYYVKWLEGLRNVYGLEFDAIGCRNEKGANFDFVKKFRATLNGHGFAKVKIHGFDNWPNDKFDFVKKCLPIKPYQDFPRHHQWPHSSY